MSVQAASFLVSFRRAGSLRKFWFWKGVWICGREKAVMLWYTEVVPGDVSAYGVGWALMASFVPAIKGLERCCEFVF